MCIWRKKQQYWGFVLPVLIPFFIFSIVPLCINFYYSLTSWNGISTAKSFVGFSNYSGIFGDRLFKKAMGFNFRLMLINMTIGNVISMSMALAANSALRTKNFARMCFYAPVILSPIVTGFIWQFFFFVAPDLNLPVFTRNWLASPKYATLGVYLVGFWKGSGSGMIYYLAGMMNIDETYYEAARVDGASPAKLFTRITLPLMMPFITLNLFFTITGAFNIYELNLALTNGGPANSTASLVLRVYTETFTKNAYGSGSAMAIVLAAIVMAFSAIQVSLTRRMETTL